VLRREGGGEIKERWGGEGQKTFRKEEGEMREVG
jgi:hypothetical protein